MSEHAEQPGISLPAQQIFAEIKPPGIFGCPSGWEAERTGHTKHGSQKGGAGHVKFRRTQSRAHRAYHPAGAYLRHDYCGRRSRRYAAALYAARAGLDTVVLEQLAPGGQAALTQRVDNYPGFDQGIDGYALGGNMRRGAERFGAKTRITQAKSLALAGAVKQVDTGDGTLLGRTVVLATGAVPRELGVAGEQELAGRGVHYCAACDGMFYRDKTVAVVGGGSSAAEDALLLSRVCSRVILIHRRDTLRAEKVYHVPLSEASNVEFRWNSVVAELLQRDGLQGIRLRNVKTEVEQTVDCDGVFVSIGRNPASGLARGQLRLDPAGYILADESTRTSIPGVFAVGDVRTKALRQIVTAAADGAVAVHYAQEYLAQGGGPF